jgi:hypothetical protein
VNKRETQKTVTVQETNYQINKIDPRTACWLFSFLAARTSGSLTDSLGKCTRDEFNEIQSIVLLKIFRIDDKDGATGLVPILSGSGLIADPLLKDDAEALFQITVLGIAFNLDPFIAGNPSNLKQ